MVLATRASQEKMHSRFVHGLGLLGTTANSPNRGTFSSKIVESLKRSAILVLVRRQQRNPSHRVVRTTTSSTNKNSENYHQLWPSSQFRFLGKSSYASVALYVLDSRNRVLMSGTALLAFPNDGWTIVRIKADFDGNLMYVEA